MKRLDTEWKHQQLIDDHGQGTDPQAEQLQYEELARQHHSGLLLINGCVDLLGKQKDLQRRFLQLSLSQITNTDTNTHLDKQDTDLLEKLDDFSDVSITNAVVFDTSESTCSDRLNPNLEIPVTNAAVTDISCKTQKQTGLENKRLVSIIIRSNLFKNVCKIC